MILYQLRCSSGHEFEAWFKDAAGFDEQSGAGTVACPICGDQRVAKAPMAPRLAKGHDRGSEEALAAARKMLATFEAMRRHVEKNCEYVGDKFAEEARKIHYEEVESHGIYGEATDDEAAELQKEGIEFGRIAWPRRND